MSPSPPSAQSLPSTAETASSALPSLRPWQCSDMEAPPERSATSIAVSMVAKMSASRRERGICPLGSFSPRRRPVGTSPERWQVIFPPRAWMDRRLSQRPSLVTSRVRVSISGRRAPPRATEAGHQRRAPDRRTCVGSIWPAIRRAGLSATSTRAAVKTSPVMPSTLSDRSSAANVRSGSIQKLRACRRRPCSASWAEIRSVRKSGSFVGWSRLAIQQSVSWTGSSSSRQVFVSPRRNLRKGELAGFGFICRVRPGAESESRRGRLRGRSRRHPLRLA